MNGILGAGRVILLARHGETEWNRVGRWQGATDIPLSDVGRAQARELGERLRDQTIVGMYASHLSRARETAEIVAAVLGLPAPIVDARLRERGYGCFEGLTRAECEARHPDAWQRYLADRRAVPPDAEPQAEVASRVSAILRQIAGAPAAAPSGPAADAVGESPAPSTVLVISHGGTIRTFIHAELGIPWPPLENGAVLRLRFDGGRFVSVEPL